MIRFVNPDGATDPEPVSGTVVVGESGVLLPSVGSNPDAIDSFDAQVIQLCLDGLRPQDIADELHCDRKRVYRSLQRSRRIGALKDVADTMEHHVVPLAVERLTEKVEAGEWEAIHATLKGTGLFRTYTQNKSESTERKFDLQVHFELPGDRPPLVVKPGNIIGKPREVRRVEEAHDVEGEGNPA